MNNREIERKYVVEDCSSYLAACWRLTTLYPSAEVYEGVSTDTFWTQPGSDFIRLRRNTSELTVKVTDRGTIEDRIEENVVVWDFDTAHRFATVVFGQAVGTLEKTYFVMETEDAIISLYTVDGDDRMFLEIEAVVLANVVKAEEVVKLAFTLNRQHESLFQLIFGEAV